MSDAVDKSDCFGANLIDISFKFKYFIFVKKSQKCFVTCGSIPHASSVIHIDTVIQHSKHQEDSPLRRVRGARKAESVKTAKRPKTARSAPAEERSPRAVDPHLKLITGGETSHRGYKKRRIRRRRGIS